MSVRLWPNIGAVRIFSLVKSKKINLLFNLGKTLLNRYETMQCRAFLCLSNLCMLMTVEEMGGSKTLFDIWCNLGRVAFESNHISDQLLEAATTSMRAIIQKLLLHHNDVVHLMKIDDIGVLCQQLTSCTEPLSKVNLVQILGTLGSMAAGTEAPLLDGRAAVVRLTGSVLMETSCRETNLWIAAEALDALFDVFKEDHTDGVAVEIQLVKSLKALAPGFKQKVHAQRRNLAEHQPIIMTAKENLLRFIKYKTRKRCWSVLFLLDSMVPPSRNTWLNGRHDHKHSLLFLVKLDESLRDSTDKMTSSMEGRWWGSSVNIDLIKSIKDEWKQGVGGMWRLPLEQARATLSPRS